MTIFCDIEDLGNGWSKFSISNLVTRCEFEFSYLATPIEDLVFAVCELTSSQVGASFNVVFPEEPGQSALSFKEIEEGTMSIKIATSSEWEEISRAYNRRFEEAEIVYSDLDDKMNFIKVMYNTLVSYFQNTNEIHNLKCMSALMEVNSFIGRRDGGCR
jgi:hypothetical protein